MSPVVAEAGTGTGTSKFLSITEIVLCNGGRGDVVMAKEFPPVVVV